MCNSIEEARANCKRVYGHENAVSVDFMSDGHYYASVEDTYWVVHPMEDASEDGHDGPGVTGIRPGALPLCKLAEQAVG